ncbi:uncharacterized protein METZ01_LOCUS183548, partial [marine metagenome]
VANYFLAFYRNNLECCGRKKSASAHRYIRQNAERLSTASTQQKSKPD